MICPYCEHHKTTVSNVRMDKFNNKLYRRRECPDCGEKFTTYEIDLGSLVGVFEEDFTVDTLQKIVDVIDREFPERDYRRNNGHTLKNNRITKKLDQSIESEVITC